MMKISLERFLLLLFLINGGLTENLTIEINVTQLSIVRRSMLPNNNGWRLFMPIF